MTPKTAFAILAEGVLTSAAPLSAQDAAPLHERTAQSDLPLDGPRAAMQLDHVGLSFDVDPEHKAISGDGLCRVRAEEALSQFVFDFDPRFHISMVRVDGELLESDHWESAGGLLTSDLADPVSAGSTRQVQIGWDGVPHEAENAPWQGGFVWSETESGKTADPTTDVGRMSRGATF